MWLSRDLICSLIKQATLRLFRVQRATIPRISSLPPPPLPLVVALYTWKLALPKSPDVTEDINAPRSIPRRACAKKRTDSGTERCGNDWRKFRDNFYPSLRLMPALLQIRSESFLFSSSLMNISHFPPARLRKSDSIWYRCGYAVAARRCHVFSHLHYIFRWFVRHSDSCFHHYVSSIAFAVIVAAAKSTGRF